MKKTIFCATLAAVFLFAEACHKNTSSSSAGGSLPAALNDLALVALNSVGGGSQNFPTIGPHCSGISVSGSFTTGSIASCPSGGYQWVATFTPNSLIATVNNCQYGGYTFNGTFNFNAASSPLVECNLITNNTDISLTGAYDITSSSFTISGDGINASCNSQGGPNGQISLTASGVSYETVPSPSTLVGTLGGKGCQTTISGLKFFWQ